MARNQALLDALNGLTATIGNDPLKAQQFATLDALIAAPPTSTDFANAFFANQDLFNANPTLAAPRSGNPFALDQFELGGEGPNSAYNSIAELQQLAAEKRIELSLAYADDATKTAAMTAILNAGTVAPAGETAAGKTARLEANAALIRTALATTEAKAFFGDLTRAHNWGDGTAPFFTNEKLLDIQKTFSNMVTQPISDTLDTSGQEIKDAIAIIDSQVVQFGVTSTHDADAVNASIKATLDAMQKMSAALAKLQNDVVTNDTMLNLPGNELNKINIRETMEQLSAVAAEAKEKVSSYKDKLISVVETYAAYVESELTDFTTKDMAKQNTLLQTARSNLVSASQALELLKQSGVGATEFSAAITAHAKAESAFLKAASTYYGKTALEAVTKLEEIKSALLITESQRPQRDAEAKDLLKAIEDVNQKIEQMQKDYSKADAANKSVVDQQLAIAAKALQDAQVLMPLIKKRIADNLGNKFMEQESSLAQKFTDELLPKNKDAAASTPAAKLATGVAVSTTIAVKVTYKRVLLTEDVVIRSTAVFTPPTPGGPPERKGILIQDSTGKVTDKTPQDTKLTSAESALMALKQAKMLLENYKPGSGDIVITGEDKDQANRVFAALLFLKEKNPLFAKVKVRSFVPDCEGPQSSISSALSFKSATNIFIEKHLTTDLRTTFTEQDKVRDDLAKFTGKITQRRETVEMFKQSIKAAVGPAKRKAQNEYDAFALKEGEDIDVDSMKTKP
jgi:hypothetical protein